MRPFRLALCFVLFTALSGVREAPGQSPVPEGARVERIAQGFRFVEGPVWQEGGLLFSDIQANTVYRWTPEGGAVVYHAPSQNSNGLALDAEGRLLLAQHGARRVARREADATETPLATRYEGARLNSPNDIAVHPDGSIYFTDPPWGINPWQAELDFTGVFRIAPDGSLHLLVDSLFYPNGIVFSPDYTTLYVSTSHEQTVVAYDVDGHTLANGRVFARTPGRPGEATDGMETDAEGRLYVAGPGGVWIFAPDGTLLDRIDVPEQTTNLTLGDADGRTLYITSGTGLYRIRLNAGSGVGVAEPPARTEDFHLTTYPNPAGEAFALRFELAGPAAVDIRLYDVLGRTVRTIAEGPRAPGSHELTVSVADLSPGSYLLRLSTGEASVTRALTVRR